MPWTNPQQPADDNEIQLDADRQAYNYEIVVDANPWMANYPDVAYQIANSGMSPQQLQEQSINLFAHLQANQLRSVLPTLSNEEQRSIYNQLPEYGKQLLSSTGYIPPAGYQENWVDDALGALGTAIALPFMPLQALTRVPVVGGPTKWGLNVMMEMSDMPARLYRTARQMEPWEVGVMAAGAALGVASRGRIARGGSQFGRFLARADATARGIGRTGVWAATVAPPAFAGAYVGGQLTDLIPGPTDFNDAFNRAADGESLFLPQAYEQIAEISVDTRVQNLARNAAFYLDEYALRGSGRTLAEELALDVASQRDSLKDEVYRNSAQQFIAENYIDANDPRFPQFSQALAELLADERFMEMVRILQNNKISFGRDVANTLRLEPGTTLYNLVSGTADATFVWMNDPFLGSVPYFSSARRGALTLGPYAPQHGSGWMFRKKPPSNMTNIERRIWLSEQNVRNMGRVDDDIVAALNANDTRLLPQQYLPVWDTMRTHFTATQHLNATGKTVREITKADLYMFYRHTDNVTSLLGGEALVKGLPYDVVSNRRANINQNALRRGLREFRAKLTEPTFAVRINQLAKEHGVDADVVLKNDISPNLGIDYSPPVGEIPDSLSLAGGIVGNALGKANATVNQITRTQGTLGQFVDSISTMSQTTPFVALIGQGAEQGIARLINTLGVLARMPYRLREQTIANILAINTVAGRRTAIRAFYNQFFEITGIKYRPRGQEFIDDFIQKSEQAFGYNGADLAVNPGLNELVGKAGLDAGHQSHFLAVPSIKELSRAVRDDIYMNSLMGVTRNGQFLDVGMSKLWKPAVLMRYGFIPRAAGEEALAWVMRGTEFSVMQNIGARQVAKYELYKSVSEQLQSGARLYQLSPAERAVVDKRLFKHIHGPMERLVTQQGTNVSRIRQTAGRMMGPAEHLVLKGYESFVRWLGRYKGVPQLDAMLRQIGKRSKNLETLIAGRKHSWTYFGARGLAPELVQSAHRYTRLHAGTMAGSLSARMHNQFNTDMGRIEPAFLVQRSLENGNTPIVVNAVGGVRQRVSQADSVYPRAYWEEVHSKLNDDPLKAPLYAEELPRRPPTTETSYNPVATSNILTFVDELVANANTPISDIVLHLAMLEPDLWRVLADRLNASVIPEENVIGAAIANSMSTGTFEFDKLMDGLRSVVAPGDRARIIEMWGYLENASPNVRGYTKALIAQHRNAPIAQQLPAGALLQPPGVGRGQRLYMGKTPGKSAFLFDVDPITGELIITSTWQPQWSPSSSISMSIDPYHSMRYAISSWENINSPYTGALFEIDADWLMREFGLTLDDVLAQPSYYAGVPQWYEPQVVHTGRFGALQSDFREIAINPNPRMWDNTGDPRYASMTRLKDAVIEYDTNGRRLLPQQLLDDVQELLEATPQALRNQILSMQRASPLEKTWRAGVPYEQLPSIEQLENIVTQLRSVDEQAFNIAQSQQRQLIVDDLLADPEIAAMFGDLTDAGIRQEAVETLERWVTSVDGSGRFRGAIRDLEDTINQMRLAEQQVADGVMAADQLPSFEISLAYDNLRHMLGDDRFVSPVDIRAGGHFRDWAPSTRASMEPLSPFLESIRSYLDDNYFNTSVRIPPEQWRALGQQEIEGMLDEALTIAEPARSEWATISDSLLKRQAINEPQLALQLPRIQQIRKDLWDVSDAQRQAVATVRDKINNRLAQVIPGTSIETLNFNLVFDLADAAPDVAPVIRQINDIITEELQALGPELADAIAFVNDAANFYSEVLKNAEGSGLRGTKFERLDGYYSQHMSGTRLTDVGEFVRVMLGESPIEPMLADDVHRILSGAMREAAERLRNEQLAQPVRSLLEPALFERGITSTWFNPSTYDEGYWLLSDFLLNTNQRNMSFDPRAASQALQDFYIDDVHRSIAARTQGGLPPANKSTVATNAELVTRLQDQYNARFYRPENSDVLQSTDFSVAVPQGTVANPVPQNMTRYFFPELRNTDKLEAAIKQLREQTGFFDIARVIENPDGSLVLNQVQIEELTRLLVRNQVDAGPPVGVISRMTENQRVQLLTPFVEQALLYPMGSVNQVIRSLGVADPQVAWWITGALSNIRADIMAGGMKGMNQIDVRTSTVMLGDSPNFGSRQQLLPETYGIETYRLEPALQNQVSYVSGNILADGTVGVHRDTAIAEWTSRSIESDMHLFAKGSKEEYQIIADVYQLNSTTGELDLIPRGTVVDSSVRQLFDADGQRIDYNDKRYLKVVGSQQEDLNWALLGPMIVDYWEGRGGRHQVIPTGAADIATNSIIPDADFIPTRHSRVDHVEQINKFDRPNIVIGRQYSLEKVNKMSQFVDNFFEKQVGPAIDAIVRNPMSFAAYHEARLTNMSYLPDLLDRRVIDTLTNDVRLPDGRLVPGETLIDPAILDEIIDGYLPYMDPDTARAAAIYHVLIEAVDENALAYYKEGLITGNAVRDASTYDYYVPGTTGPERIEWDTPKTGNETAIPKQLPEGLNSLNISNEMLDALATMQKHIELIDRSAAQKAIRNVVPFIDSAEFRSVWSVKMSNLLPFWYAEENFIKRWLRGANNGMFGIDQVVKAQYAINGLMNAGIMYEDNGTYYFNWPGSAMINEIVGTVFRVPLSGTALRSRADSLLPGINPEAGRVSGGPLLNIPVSAFTYVLGEIAPSLKDETTEFRRHILGDIGSTQSWENQFVPASVRRLWRTLTSYMGEDRYDEALMANMVNAAINLDAAGLGFDEQATEEEKQVFWDRVRTQARFHMFAQFVWGLFLPGNPQTIETLQSPFSFENITGLGLENPSSVVKGMYLDYIRTWGVDEGTLRFLREFPDANINYVVNPEAYLVSRSETVSGAPLPPNEQNLVWFTENEQWIKSLPQASIWFVPNKSYENEEWNDYAWAEQFSSDLRIKKTPQEVMDAIHFRRAAPAYFLRKEAYEQMRADAGDNAELKRLLDADWEMQSASYLRTHPIFARMLANRDGQQQRLETIDQMRVALNDPAAPTSPWTPAIRELFDKWNEFQLVQSELALDRSNRSEEVRAYNRTSMQNWVDEWLIRNPQLESLWVAIFKPETDL